MTHISVCLLECGKISNLNCTVFRPGLAQRLQKLEKELRIPEADRMETEGELREAEDVTVGASRIYRRADSLTLGKNLKPIKKDEENGSTIHNYFGGTRVEEAPKSKGTVVCCNFNLVCLTNVLQA